MPRKFRAKYPWRSLGWYFAAPAHRPAWLRVDRRLGEHGIAEDSLAGRQEIERRVEARRQAETPAEEFRTIRRGWCFGPPEFRKGMHTRMGEKLGPSHAGEMHQESAAAKEKPIMAEQLRSRNLTEEELQSRSKGDPVKIAIAARLRQETTLSLKCITARVGLRTSKSANARLHKWMRAPDRINSPGQGPQMNKTNHTMIWRLLQMPTIPGFNQNSMPISITKIRIGNCRARLRMG